MPSLTKYFGPLYPYLYLYPVPIARTRFLRTIYSSFNFALYLYPENREIHKPGIVYY